MTLDAWTSRALSACLAAEQSRRRLPSVVAGLVREGELVWHDEVGSLDGRAGGPVPTADTQYRLGSISKTFVAVEVMRLRDEGTVDLADAIVRYLPEMPVDRVTVAQLLTHTSGLQAETNGPWWERTGGGSWDDLLASGMSLRFTPGTTHHYSNVGYAVLGELVTRLRGEPWPDAVASGLLRPLGMSRTTTRPVEPSAPGLAVLPWADLVHVEPEHDAGAMGPAGQLWSTVADMTAWIGLLAGRRPDLLAGGTLTEMLRPAAVNDVPHAAWAVAHGLGWQVWNVEGRRFAGHGGSMPGFLAQLRVDLETGDGAIVMTNATSGLGTATTDLMTLLREREPVAPTPWTADPTQADRLGLAGPWFWGTYQFVATIDADGFRLGEPGQGRGARFRPDGDDGWVGLDGYYRGEPLTIDRDETGRPVRLVLASFVFTREPYETGADVPGGLDPSGWH